MKVIIEDRRSYVSGKEVNGGGYIFTITATELEGDLWVFEFGTSSEFPYCPKVGQFRECHNRPNSERGQCYGSFTITDKPIEFTYKALGLPVGSEIPDTIRAWEVE